MSSPINKVIQAVSGNFSTASGSFDPGKIRGIILHPYSADLLSTANNATKALRQTALQTLLTATYANRGFFIHKLDAPTDNGEKEAYETRDQLKKQTDKGSWDKIFTLEGTWAQYQMLKNYHKRGGMAVAFIDENNVLWHLKTDTGISGFTVHEITVPRHDDPETGKAVRYYLRIALADISEIESMYHTELEFNPFSKRGGLLGVEPWVLEDATPSGASAGVFYMALKNADAQINLVPNYASILNVSGAWEVVTTTGAAITITGVTINTTGTEKDAFILTLDTADSDYNVGDPLYIRLKDNATLAGSPYNIKYAETNTITVTAS